MDKWIKLSHTSSPGLTNLSGGLSLGQALEPDKSACSDQTAWMKRVSNIDAKIISFIQKHSFDHDRYTYVIVVPLGSDESWEQTINGDSFERKFLEPKHKNYGHRTFVTNARAYMHHKNTDPKRSFGDFPCMFYNGPMDRCEGIWRLDHELAKGIPGASRSIRNYQRGKDVPISMGCKVPFDVCSICSNEAKDPSEYCDHVTTPGFGSVDSKTGVKMRVFNPWPLFFDLSPVNINAAPEATPLGWIFPELISFLKSMSKTSSVAGSGHRIIVPSSYAAAYHHGFSSGSRSLQKHSLAPVKISDMIKHIPVLGSQVLKPLEKVEDEIPPDKIEDTVKSSMSQRGALSNFGAMGIVLRPSEFRHMLLCGSDMPETEWPSMVEDEIREGFTSGGSKGLLEPESLRGHILAQIKSLAPERSILYPHLARRIAWMRQWPSSEPRRHHRPAIKIKLDVTVPKGLGHLYGQYLRELAFKMAQLVREMLSRFPTMGHDLGDNPKGNLSGVIAGLTGNASSGIKTSQLAAQALLPSAYILHRAGSLDQTDLLMGSVDVLNKPDTARVFGGVYGS